MLLKLSYVDYFLDWRAFLILNEISLYQYSLLIFLRERISSYAKLFGIKLRMKSDLIVLRRRLVNV